MPSQTEFLFEIGLEREVVGITRFCIHPKEKVKAKTRIGGTKRFDFKKIQALQPDLIVGNKEENYREGIEELLKYYPVWMSDVSNLAQAYEMMLHLAELTGKSEQAGDLVEKIKQNFQALEQSLGKRVIYLIWKDPYMSVGGDTFIHAMLEKCGFENVVKEKKRYPVVGAGDIKNYHPDLILLSSEPYPFKEKHIAEFRTIFPDMDIALVDGEYFSWYGSRLQYTPAYFQKIKELL